MKRAKIYHHIPEEIEVEAREALEGFPELSEVPIAFKIRPVLNGSIMMAQPNFIDFLKPWRRQGYVILISRSFRVGKKHFTTTKLPSKIKIGWFAHELGHIMDYRKMNTFGLLKFGFLYLTSRRFFKAAELRADTFATLAGFGEHLIQTKKFVTEHSELPEAYKEKIRKYYPSPDQILEIDRNMRLVAEVDDPA